MAESASEHPPLRASERLMDLLGKPAPPTMTSAEEAAYRAAMDDADRQLAELIARRRQRAA
jgi:hypothetical protein